MAWTDEKRALVISEYKDIMANEYDSDETRAAASVEVVKELAETHGETSNGVRMILSKDGCYIKKATVTKTTTKEGTTKRINKAEAIQTLKDLISGIDPALVDNEILDKLTGKAANYFSSILQTTAE